MREESYSVSLSGKPPPGALFAHEGRTMWTIAVRLAHKSELCERSPWQRGEAGMRR